MAEEALIAVFIDFENLALGARDMSGNAEFQMFGDGIQVGRRSAA